MRGHRRAVVVGVVVGCLVAGCSGQAGDQGGGSATTTGTSAVSTTAGAPTSTTATTTAQAPLTSAPQVDLPPAATAHTEEGAKAFASYFIEQADMALVEANAYRLAALASPTCKGCTVFKRWAETLREEGHHHAARCLSIHRQIRRPSTSPDLYVTDLLIDEREVDVLDHFGSKVASEPAQRATLRTTLKWAQSRWTVVEMLLVKN